MNKWRVVEAELPPGVRGLCDWGTRTISVRPDLSWAQLRVTLAHELLHAERGPFPRWQEAREEAAIDQQVARDLIDVWELGEALAAHPHDTHQVADELDVTPAIVAVRVKHLHPSERHYLKRRLDDGQ